MTITVGTPFTIDSAAIFPSAGFVRSAQLSSTKAIVIYTDADNSLRPTATVVESDETTGTPFEIAAQSNSTRPRVVALSSTKALAYWRSAGGNSNFRVLNISGTTITASGAILTASFTTSAVPHSDLVNLTSANSLFVYVAGGATSHAVIMSVSGNTVTEESGDAISGWAAAAWDFISISALSSTKVLCCYDDGSASNRGTATILNISGTTISDGGVDTVFESGDTDSISVDTYSTTRAIVTYGDNGDSGKGKAQIITVSGNTPSSNTPLTYQSAAVSETAVATFDSNNAVVMSVGPDTVTELSVAGTTITKGDESSLSIVDNISVIAYDSTTVLGAYNSGAALVTVTGVIITLTSPATVLSLAAMTKPADIDASGAFIYVALLDNGTPILFKISTALDADGVTVFDPGAGTNIGVECGRFNADVVWVAGAFDGTNVVEKSGDAGSSFVVKDDGTFADVEAFAIGPDSDERCLVADITIEIQETIDDGAIWIQHNASTGFNINAVARLGKNVQESVFGNDAGGGTDNIDYTINSGADMEDFTTGVFPNADVTRVIVS
jgi:hypothetical protein